MKSTWLPLALVVLGLAIVPASADDTTGWHVVRSGETLEGITAKYLGDSSLWREVWRLNPGIGNPNLLTPGQRIRVILSRTLPARFAEIRRVSRRVEKKPEPQPWEPARAGDRLAERHGVQTHAAASAELRFEDDSLLTLTERSLVFLRAFRGVTPKRDRSEIEIVDGQGDLEKPARTKRTNDIEITVGTAKAKPQPGPAKARFRAVEKSARVMSYRGGTSVEAGGASVRVAEGMGVSVPEGGRPGKPERLLRAPALQARDFAVARPTLEWPRVDGAASYTVEICRDRGCGEVVSRTTGLTSNRWRPAEGLEAGAMFWRVTPRSTSDLDGYPGVAPLTIRLGISGTVATDGKPSPGVSVAIYRSGTLAGSTSTGGDGGYLFGRLEPGEYSVVVDSRTVSPDGTHAEQAAGPAGGICGGLPLAAAGGCAGGKSEAGDDASSLDGAEHVARVVLESSPAGDVDFGFSLNLVTTTADNGQGSLRQFVENANATAGPNEMLFAPAAAANDGERWAVRLASPLPPLRDAGTTLDGRARDRLRLERVLPARLQRGTVTRVGTALVTLENPDKPTLHVHFGGAPVGIDAPYGAVIRNLGLAGAGLQVRSGGPLLVENSVLGALLQRADRASGIEAHDETTVKRTILTGFGGPAIELHGVAHLHAEHLEVSDSAYAAAAPAAVLLASGDSRISTSMFLLNTGAPAIRTAGIRDTIESSTFRGNRVAVAAATESMLLIRGNVFEDNGVAAVAAAGRSPDVAEVAIREDGSTRVRGRAASPGRVEVLDSGAGDTLTPVAAAEASADGSFDLVLPRPSGSTGAPGK